MWDWDVVNPYIAFSHFILFYCNTLYRKTIHTHRDISINIGVTSILYIKINNIILLYNINKYKNSNTGLTTKLIFFKCFETIIMVITRVIVTNDHRPNGIIPWCFSYRIAICMAKHIFIIFSNSNLSWAKQNFSLFVKSIYLNSKRLPVDFYTAEHHQFLPYSLIHFVGQ